MPIPREQLYQEVWAEPMLAVAKRYEVSGSYLARICEQLRVPRPPRGYWAQLQVGKVPPRPELPQAEPGDELAWYREGEARPVPALMAASPPTARATTASSSEQSSRPKKRASHHPLLLAAKEHFLNSHKRSYFDDGYLRPKKQLLVDLVVSEEALDRAIRVANALFLALEDAGHRVVIAPHGPHYAGTQVDVRGEKTNDYERRHWRPIRPTVAFMNGGIVIGLKLFERSERVPARYQGGQWVRANVKEQQKPRRGPPLWNHDYTTQHDFPSGRFCLHAYSPYHLLRWSQQWEETRRGELEGMLEGIRGDLENAAKKLPAMLAEAEREEAERRAKADAEHREWQRKEAERRRRENYKASREHLLSLIDSWSVAKHIAAFLTEAEFGVSGLEGKQQEAMTARLQQAREMFGDTNVLRYLEAWEPPPA